MKKIGVLLFTFWMLIACQQSFAAEGLKETSLNQTMSQIGQVMTDLYPLISTEQQLSKDENKKIFNSVTRLQTLFAQAGPEIQKKSATYQMSYQLLQDYLASITTVENPAVLSQMKQKLLTLSDFCVSCHTQDNKFRTLFSTQKPPKLESLLAFAEFNFATRNYLEAAEYFEKYLFMTSNLNDSQVLKALHRILSIYMQVLNNPEDAQRVFMRLKAMEKLSDSNDSYVLSIIDALENFKKSGVSDVQAGNFPELMKYAGQYLGSSNAHEPFIFASPLEEVQRLWLRGVLFRYLNSGPNSDEMPPILYWLAVADRSLGYGYDYTLADFYLKQCITRYSRHPMARRCFTDYKAYVTFYFTSLTEPVLPLEIDRQLKALEAHLKQ